MKDPVGPTASTVTVAVAVPTWSRSSVTDKVTVNTPSMS